MYHHSISNVSINYLKTTPWYTEVDNDKTSQVFTMETCEGLILYSKVSVYFLLSFKFKMCFKYSSFKICLLAST